MPSSNDNPNHFSRCSSCGKILFDNVSAAAPSGTPAPCCGVNGGLRAVWPDAGVMFLLRKAREIDVNDAGRSPTLVIFLSLAFELLMEQELIGLLTARNRSPRQAAEDISGKHGLAVLARQYEEISRHSLDRVAEPLGVSCFTDSLTRLAVLRSAMLADRPPALSDDDRALVVTLRDRCLKIFALIHNSLWMHTTRPDQASDVDGGTDRVVLIIDDEPQVREDMKRLIARQGCAVITAANGTDGIAMYDRYRPQCVLLDASMPDLDGLTVLEKIRSIDPAANVYMVTGIGGDAFEKAARRLGAAGYVTKPIDLETLLRIIHSPA